MPDIIQQIRDTYATDKAKALNMLPELFKAVDDGKINELPCKVGDKVFVRADTWGNTWNFVTVDYGKLLVGENIAIIKTKKTSAYENSGGTSCFMETGKKEVSSECVGDYRIFNP